MWKERQICVSQAASQSLSSWWSRELASFPFCLYTQSPAETVDPVHLSLPSLYLFLFHIAALACRDSSWKISCKFLKYKSWVRKLKSFDEEYQDKNTWRCYLIHISEFRQTLCHYDSGFTLFRKDTYCKDKDVFVFMFQNFVIQMQYPAKQHILADRHWQGMCLLWGSPILYDVSVESLQYFCRGY